MKKVLQHLSENIISLLFTIMGSEIILYSVQRKFNLIYGIVIIALVILLYILFEKVVELDKKGPLLYLAALVGIVSISAVMIKIGMEGSYTPFYGWFLGGGTILDEVLFYEFASIILIPFVFGSLSYYYSVTVVRIPMMFLIYFIALILNIKGVYKINSISNFIFIMLLFLLFIVSIKKKNINKETIVKVKQKDILLVSIAFVLIIFITSFFIPKPNKLPIISGLEEVKGIVLGAIQKTERGSGKARNYSKKTNSSMEPLSDKVLYKFRGPNPKYLVDRSYDIYEKNKWIQKNKELKKFKFEVGYDTYQTLDNTLEIIKESDKLKGDLLKINKSLGNNMDEFTNYFEIEDLDNNQITHPSKAIYFDLGNDYTVYSNGFGDIDVKSEELIKNNNKYEIDSYNEEPYRGSNEYIIMKYFNNERYMEFINENGTEDIIREEKETLENMEKQYTNLGKNVTERIKDLSLSLTKDEESFYDKAKVLENYFTSGEYEYSLELQNEKVKGEYMDYFIFEGKTGYCVQFATAMTLMARASGMPARYVEGFLVSDKDYVNGSYEVKELNGHAFTEVYIPGYGWKIFDATPSSSEAYEEVLQEEVIEENIEEDAKKQIDYKKILKVIGISFAGIIALVIGIIGLKVTKRPRYLKKVLKMPSEKAFEELIRDSMRLLEECDVRPYSGETELVFAKRVDRSMNLGLKGLIEIYYEYKYGNKKVNKEDLDKAFNINKDIYEFIKS